MEALGNRMSSNRLRLNASNKQFLWLDNGQQLRIDTQAIVVISIVVKNVFFVFYYFPKNVVFFVFYFSSRFFPFFIFLCNFIYLFTVCYYLFNLILV